MREIEKYNLFAKLFSYPDENLDSTLTPWIKTISSKHPELVEICQNIYKHFETKTLHEIQEYYIHTFDIQALCYLDIGYVLFGEDYKRGEFLVNMKAEQTKTQNETGSELPDHLPNILTLLPKLQPESAEEMIVSIMIPALQLMTDNFKDDKNIYKKLLQVLISVMDSDYPDSAFEPFIFTDPLKNGFTSPYPGCGTIQNTGIQTNIKNDKV